MKLVILKHLPELFLFHLKSFWHQYRDAFWVDSVPRETDLNTRFDVQDVPHPESAIGVFSPCSVICWEQPRGSMARSECCSGFQGEGPGGCSIALLLIAGPIKGILSRTAYGKSYFPHPVWALTPSHFWIPFLPCSCFHLHSNGHFHSTLSLTLWACPLWEGWEGWIPSHPSHCQALSPPFGLPLLPSLTYMK